MLEVECAWSFMRDRKEVTCLELRERARLIKDKVQEVTWAR